MEYIKKEELIKGEIYNSTKYNYIFKYLDKNGDKNIIINKVNNCFYKDTATVGNGLNNIINATSEEKHWLNTCIKLDKFITFEEAMKTFIPEYVECIEDQRLKYGNYGELGKVYKVLNWDYSGNDCYLMGTTSGSTSKNRFKPSTKEDYDAQFVVKEPEFVLPEKWCIFRNNEHFEEIGKWFNKINNHVDLYTNSILKSSYPYLYNSGQQGNCLSKDLRKNYVEITFEQFKKYVLKEETAIEFGNKIDKEIIEPLPQFKVIETIETITKVENNEGNQFFIGDTVKSLNSNQKGTITKFKYSADKSDIIAITTFQQSVGISINKIEHYIKPKVEVKEENLLEKAKRLYPIGTKFKSANSKAILTINNHIQEICTNPLTIIFNTVEANPEGFYYGCVHNGKGEWAKIINNK